MAVGAVLTQNTAWRNVETAIERLRRQGWLEAQALLKVDAESLAEAIRSAGYFRQKSGTLRRLAAAWDQAPQGDDVAVVRRFWLALKGIGPETADSIVLYAFGLPTFVVDAYTRRWLTRAGRLPGKGGYHEIQWFFEHNLPTSAPVFNEYHALIVQLAKSHCTARKPDCPGCPLRGADLCPGCDHA